MSKVQHWKGTAVLCACIYAASINCTAAPVEVSGVRVEETATVGNRLLKLNGAGVRIRVIFNVFVTALYLPEKQTRLEEIIASPAAKRITMVPLREITTDDSMHFFIQGIQANTEKVERTKLIPQMTKLGETLGRQRSLFKGDMVSIDWLPEQGTVIALNGNPIAEPFPDIAFYNAILKIFIGDKPADLMLKSQLLGIPRDLVVRREY